MNKYFVGRYFKVMKINQYQSINLFIYLFILIQMHIYFFNLLGYNPLLTLFWCSNNISSNHLMCYFNISPSFFEYFFSSTKWCSGLILRFSHRCSQPFPQETLVSFSREWYLESKMIWIVCRPLLLGLYLSKTLSDHS